MYAIFTIHFDYSIKHSESRSQQQQQPVMNNEAHSRETPPFVEFETVRQRLRISLPEEQMQGILGLRDMEEINEAAVKGRGIDFRQFMDYANGRIGEVKGRGNKKSKEKYRGEAVKNKNKKDDDERLSSQFTQPKQKQKPSKKSKQTSTTKPKKQQPNLDIFSKIEQPDYQYCTKQYPLLNNFSQCLNPVPEDLRKIYNVQIHSQRLRNNRSNNLEAREKVYTHRRGQSQVLQIHPNHKTTKPAHKPSKPPPTAPKPRLYNNPTIPQHICNESLEQVPWSRAHSQVSENNRMQQKHNKCVLEELYNSSDGDAIDSQDERLVTMVSQDMRSIREERGWGSDRKERDEWRGAGIGAEEMIKSRLYVENIVSQEPQMQPQMQPQIQPQAQTIRLSQTIESILHQIQQIKQQQQYRSQQSSSQPQKYFVEKWVQQPSLLELQIILDNCLNNGEYELSNGRVLDKNKEGRLGNSNRSSVWEDKWRETQVRRINKAQKLLKEGYIMANRILGSQPHYKQDHKLIHKQNNSKQDKPRKYAQKRLKNNSHSMSYLQSTTRTLKPAIKQPISHQKPSQPLKLLQLSDTISIVGKIEQQQQPTYQKQVQMMRKLMKMKEETGEIEEIVEIMILDLCIEIIQDVEIGFTTNTANLFENLYMILSKKKARKRLGFSTSPNQTLIFLQKFSKFLQSSRQPTTNLTYKQVIHRRIQQPIGPKPLQLLKFMRDGPQTGSPEQSMEQEQQPEERETFALSLPWFHEFSQLYIREYNFGNYYENDEERENKRKIFLRNAMHVHNKSIFDAINETIDKYRPYGVLGEPFPWKNYSKPQPITPLKFNTILNDTFQQVSQQTRYLCGIFSQQHLAYKLTQLEFLQFTEDRLNKMLCKHINQNEVRWNFIDDEETEIMVDLGRLVFRSLMKEMAREMVDMGLIRADNSR